ncbi:MAG: 16S rRNA (adenine(1518)-N(6)/adenine(1519)-N(6))-dimethyltransferase RsmA [Candidatus Pacebacteria bacterium]|nr:16S rRNA (adenine(1518)-N(6)/adenine(1519)-N(6))-dimethyltransferase RsmA [Candidatus Paceibacterota bacterium]MCF7857327.1 16S rRNA (adenine(1518)-N(6)/adenine(1519)-N(6))-dimethyltransferase RsmA [Candidatus Paceibacterota bacterium]
MHENLTKIDAKKSLGQNFLNNAGIPRAMADAGEVMEADIVLEIGPGTGALTRELLERGAKVVAIETDHRAIEALNTTFFAEITAKKLVIVDRDIREVDLEALGLRPRAYKIIANIPYYLSGFLFRFFLEHNIQPATLVFLVQKEVAVRIVRDKKESLLSLSVKVFGEPKYVKTVGRGNFTPQPKIDSAIIAISDISKDRLEGITQEDFFAILHEGFKSKRKQLIGNLLIILDRGSLIHIFSTLNISLKVRGEDLALPIWINLCKKILEKTKIPR